MHLPTMCKVLGEHPSTEKAKKETSNKISLFKNKVLRKNKSKQTNKTSSHSMKTTPSLQLTLTPYRPIGPQGFSALGHKHDLNSSETLKREKASLDHDFVYTLIKSPV